MEKSQILKRWAAHSKSVLNRPSTISRAPTGRLSQAKINVGLDLMFFLPETIRVVQQLSSGLRSNPSRNLQARRPPPDGSAHQPAWRKEVKTGSAIYETDRIAAAKAK
nr:unnamed protein product [Spirometra erinaceieuropaei]